MRATDHRIKGAKLFTWWNGKLGTASIFARLDRSLYNTEWLQHFPSTKVTHLSRQYSDHAALLVSFFDSSSQPAVQVSKHVDLSSRVFTLCEL